MQKNKIFCFCNQISAKISIHTNKSQKQHKATKFLIKKTSKTKQIVHKNKKHFCLKQTIFEKKRFFASVFFFFFCLANLQNFCIVTKIFVDWSKFDFCFQSDFFENCDFLFCMFCHSSKGKLQKNEQKWQNTKLQKKSCCAQKLWVLSKIQNICYQKRQKRQSKGKEQTLQ